MLTCVVDYASFTLPSGFDLAVLKAMLCGAVEWEEAPGGWRNYEQSERCGFVRIGYGGQWGVHVDVSGQGCRQLDRDSGEGWRERIQRLISLGARFTRLDLAWDDKAGLLDLDVIEDHVRRGAICTRAKKMRIVESGPIGGAKSECGKTVYVGSGACECSARFYDKAVEQGVAGHWVRCELQMRGRTADRAAELVGREGVGAAAGLLERFVSFRACVERRYAHRAPIAEWWSRATECVAKAKLVLDRRVRTVWDVQLWFAGKFARTVAMLTKAGCKSDFFTAMYREGKDRLSSKQVLMLRRAGFAAT